MMIFEKTNWFPSHIKPVHAGWYEVGHDRDVHHSSSYFLTGSRRFWDGISWRAGWINENVSIFGTNESHQWRGITQACYFEATGVQV